MTMDGNSDHSQAVATANGNSEIARFLNRDLTWLSFNERVLHEALDPRTPLLERARFLQIFTSNLDEFYMKRVGGLKRQLVVGVSWRSSDGMSGPALLREIRAMVEPMLEAQARVYREEIRPALAENGIHLLKWDELTEDEQQRATQYFDTNVFPVLTPLGVDPGHPFPFLSNLSVSLGVCLQNPESEEKMFARVKVPGVLPGWLDITEPEKADETGQRFVLLRSVIEANLSKLFHGMEVLAVMPFRVTRNADVDRDEEDTEDLLEMIAQELRQRRFAKIVRLEHTPNPNRWMLDFLMRELELSADDVYEMPEKLDYLNMGQIANIDEPSLHYEPWKPVTPPRLADPDQDIFSVIRDGDVLVHHPYESFNDSVERFIRQAAADPKVLAIKMTVYRTGDDSPFIKTLVRAAEMGKQAVCLVELKARFDEERNIYWAQTLEKSGVHVVYGVIGLKTHTKTALVVRQEDEGVRCYAHIGTGNYHAGTAKLYTDVGILTCDPVLTADVVNLFHYLTGRSLPRAYERMLVAPVNMRSTFEALIDREVEHLKAGRPARIVAKFNSLEDQSICEKLYEASQAGLQIDLIVRGFCCLRPQLPGVSDNIRVISVIGRFLEHSRIYWFQNGQEDPVDGESYIGSADWMYRNLNNRVEAITPVMDRSARERLWNVLELMLNDQRQAWDMNADGSYVQRRAGDDASEQAAIGTHRSLMRLATSRSSGGSAT